MVGGEHDHGVVGVTARFEGRQDLADALVGVAHRREVGAPGPAISSSVSGRPVQAAHSRRRPGGDQAIALRFEEPEDAAQNIGGLAGRRHRRGGAPADYFERPPPAERLGITYNSSRLSRRRPAATSFLRASGFMLAGLLVPDFHRICSRVISSWAS